MLVVDSSFLIAILFAEEYTDFAAAHLDAAIAEGLVAPALLNWELANVLRTKVLRNPATPQEAVARLRSVAKLSIGTPEQEPTTETLLTMALDTGLSVYDTAYVELAQRLVAPLATLDGAMAKAARGLGLVVHAPFP